MRRRTKPRDSSYKKNLTQDQLAELSGLCKNYVSHIETGNRDVSLSTIIALCRALKVKPSALLDHLT